MTKVTIDRALIEQAVDAAFSPYCAQDLAILAPALRAALEQPAVEPVSKGLFVDLIAQHPGLAEELAAIVVDAPPAEPARTSQDVCTVPLLSDEEIIDAGLSIGWVVRYMDKSESEFARAIEQLVRRKAGL